MLGVFILLDIVKKRGKQTRFERIQSTRSLEEGAIRFHVLINAGG